MIIAIDGPAGSGKSTIAREVAKKLGLRYLDTGAMYRTVTLLALEAGLIPDRIGEAGALAAAAPIRLEQRENDLSRVFVGEREVTDEIRGRTVSQNVSAVSADPAVREVLTKKQQDEAAKGDVVLEGRDMGTVVVPDADVKVFLTASIEERARRRRLQLQAQGASQPLEELIADITARDAYDSGRELAPLRKADDAVELDTTGMTIAEVIAAVSALAARVSEGSAALPGAAPAVPPVSPPAVARSAAPPPGATDSRRGGKYALCRMIRGPLDRLLYRFAYSFIPAVTRFLYRMEITGTENIPATGGVVLASNHRSNLDPFFVGSSFPRMIHFMAKAELWSFKPLGWLLEILGVFPVNRGEADRNAVRQALQVLDAGAVVGLFPEGRRQREKELGEIRAGVALFSLREGVVTIPVVMRGTDRVVKNHLLRFPRVRVAFGPPVEVPGRELPRAERAEVVTARLVAAFHELLALTAEGAAVAQAVEEA
jgi:cytidylate kinase